MTTSVQLVDVSTPATIADELGAVRAEIKQLQDKAKVLETLLKNQHTTSVDGDLYHVAISYGVETKRVDWKTVAQKLEPSRQLVAAHTKTTTADRVRVSAHKKGA